MSSLEAYELTTTNVNSYRVLLHGREGIDFSDRELSVNIDYLLYMMMNFRVFFNIVKPMTNYLRKHNCLAKIILLIS